MTMEKDDVRRHHNNKGLRQIKEDKTHKQLVCICARIFKGTPFTVKNGAIIFDKKEDAI